MGRTQHFCEITTLDLSYVIKVKSTVEILQNFVAISKHMNFTCFYSLVIIFFRNPCCDVESGSISSAPASSSLNYLRLLPSAARTNENSVSNISEEGNWRENSNSCTENGYVTPRPSSVITCGCQTLQSSQYQNLSTDHTCPSTTSSVA